MKKIILSLLCLLIISLGISCVCASSDMANATGYHDFSQTDYQNTPVNKIPRPVEQSSTPLPAGNVTSESSTDIQGNMTSGNVTDVAVSGNETSVNVTDIQGNVTSGNATDNSTNKSNTTIPKLNITGPKINGTKLDIKGPNPCQIVLSDQDYINLFSKVFRNHPDWEMDRIIKSVLNHCPWYKAPKYVSEAYAIALQYKGDEMLYKNGISAKDVDAFMNKYPYLIFPEYEDYPFRT